MSAESIEARTHELMSMQKVELARRVAEYEDAHAVYSTHAAVFAHSEPAPVIEQGTDPEIIDVAPASTEPEVLEPSPLLTDVLHPDLLEAIAPAFANAAIEGADAAPAEPEAQ